MHKHHQDEEMRILDDAYKTKNQIVLILSLF